MGELEKQAYNIELITNAIKKFSSKQNSKILLPRKVSKNVTLINSNIEAKLMMEYQRLCKVITPDFNSSVSVLGCCSEDASAEGVKVLSLAGAGAGANVAEVIVNSGAKVSRNLLIALIKEYLEEQSKCLAAGSQCHSYLQIYIKHLKILLAKRAEHDELLEHDIDMVLAALAPTRNAAIRQILPALVESYSASDAVANQDLNTLVKVILQFEKNLETTCAQAIGIMRDRRKELARERAVAKVIAAQAVEQADSRDAPLAEADLALDGDRLPDSIVDFLGRLESHDGARVTYQELKDIFDCTVTQNGHMQMRVPVSWYRSSLSSPFTVTLPLPHGSAKNARIPLTDKNVLAEVRRELRAVGITVENIESIVARETPSIMTP